jgi:hypothetical protein
VTQFSVQFMVEADSLEEAEALVGQWVVTPGTVLQSLIGMSMSTLAPSVMTDGGTVSGGESLMSVAADDAEGG